MYEKMKKVSEKETGFRVAGVSRERKQLCAEVEFYSEIGEDVIVNVFFDKTWSDFCKAFQQCAADFDVDEHAERNIEMRGQRGVPDSIRVLLDDADSIKDTLEATTLVLDSEAYDDDWNPVDEDCRIPRKKVYKYQSEGALYTALTNIKKVAVDVEGNCDICPFYSIDHRRCRFSEKPGCAPLEWVLPY